MSSSPPSYQIVEVDDQPVFVSRGARKLGPRLYQKAVREHGQLSGSRETKHRFSQGTLMVASTSATGEIVVATAAELRALRGGLEKFSPTFQSKRPGYHGPKGKMS